MRIITSAIYFSAALFTSTLCDEHIHANFHERRALSDLLKELATAEPEGNNVALNSQLEAIKTATGVQTGDGVVTYIIGGNEVAKTASLPENKGAIWVTVSNGKFVGGGAATPAAEQATSTSAAAVENSTSASPSAQEPSATTPPAEVVPTKSATSMTTTLTETKTVTVAMGLPTGGALPPQELPPAALVPGVLPPSAIVPGILPPSAVQEGMTLGTGRIENGACNCACNCPVNAFPMGARPVIPLPSTTLATVILPPTTPVALPTGGLLVDTRPPPPPGGVLMTAPIAIPNPTAPSSTALPTVSAPAAIVPPAVIASAVSTPAAIIPAVTSTTSLLVPVISSTSSIAVPIPSQPLPVVAPPPVASIPPAVIPTAAATTSPESSLQLGLSTAITPPLPTAVAELVPPGETTINIETFSLASTLILGSLG